MLLRAALLGGGLLLLALLAWPAHVPIQGREGLSRKDAGGPKADLWVDSKSGRPSASGTQDQPCQSLSQAIKLLPEPLTHSVTIQVADGEYSATGGCDMPANRSTRRRLPGWSRNASAV